MWQQKQRRIRGAVLCGGIIGTMRYGSVMHASGFVSAIKETAHGLVSFVLDILVLKNNEDIADYE
jgi:hypothetical protein